MARKTKKTLRKLSPISKELVKLANDLDRINRRLMFLADKVSDKEFDSNALQRFMATVEVDNG